MNTKRFSVILILVGIIGIVISCNKESVSGEEYVPKALELRTPSHFPELDIPKDNPLTEEGVELGKRLYYDSLLSVGGPNAGLSCSSCHSQDKSFSSPAGGTSVLPHVNLAWSANFLWDGRVGGTLEDIMLFEVKDFFQADLNVLQSTDVYPEMYWKAFGDSVISYQNSARAMAQFFRTMISGNSKFDRYLRKEGGLTTTELQGMEIFFTEKGDCFHCHSAPLMTNNNFHNIGLDSVFNISNEGRYSVTGKTIDMGCFKTPTLRNIELTSPYMHDGRFTTLTEVVNHYNNDVQNSPSLDPLMTKSGKEFGLQLTTAEVESVVAFLLTLTDTTFTTNPELSKPF